MLNQIRYFQSVVKNSSFTEAAEECHISQSAISQQIKALEAELGVQLLLRKNRKFELTEAGAYFYKKSLILIADCDRLVQDTVRVSRSDSSELRIGYLKSYGSLQLQNAVSEFTAKYPDIKVTIVGGNHEDLYDLLRTNRIDIVLNDQRRAFSDAYVNCSLAYKNTYAEIAVRNPMAQLEAITPSELKNTPCILIASKDQQKTEQEYYRTIIGIESEILFASSLEEARLMTVQNNGFMPVDEGSPEYGNTTVRVPLVRGGKQLSTHYCAFRKADNSDRYAEEFTQILKKEF